MRSLHTSVYFVLYLVVFASCNHIVEKDYLFVLREDINISFNNQLDYTEDFNPYTYRNFYNGGGVALGDINNDGLIDVYLTGNIVDNKLFLNKGNWQFEDITISSGTACHNVWSSGANFVDINGDGLLDLYVCKAGKPEGDNRHNELFINQGDLTFKEESKEYGLDIEGLSIQSAFFDYDRDGDLDCYLLNNSIRSVGGLDLVDGKRNEPSKNGNKFLENRNNRFYDVSEEVGIYTSDIGYGLGITLSDFNLDGWTDIYISNDFFEKDYLYINNQDGTFVEKGEDCFENFPAGAMGADAADLDNDLSPDLFITEMLPSTLERKKTKAVYESWKKASLAAKNGYAHQMPRNVLQRNMGNESFLELGRLSQLESSDWSWSSVLQDFDNDGLKDIIITNGIYKDLLDRDYLAFIANDSNVKSLVDRKKNAITNLIDSMPSQAISNRAHRNIGNFRFEEVTSEWGLETPSFSNGISYGDLDNDGDLDLIVNNVNMPSFFYENRLDSENKHFIQLDLVGKDKNTKAIGTKVIAHACGQTYMTEQYPSRGFQSSISNILTLGMSNCNSIDSIQILWYDGSLATLSKPEIDQRLRIHIDSFDRTSEILTVPSQRSKQIDTLAFGHKEIRFNQFDRERLMYKMNVNEGPSISVGDLNNDGIKDVFLGGAKNQPSEIWISDKGIPFHAKAILDNNVRSEVTSSALFDSDMDGDLDIYIGHGGTAFSPYAAELHDLHYINNGDGTFSKNQTGLHFDQPIATSAVSIADYNQDGLLDIVISERNSNKNYGQKGSVIILENKGNNLFEKRDIPVLQNIGILTDVQWININGDDLLDLIVVGEWMSIKVFVQTKNGFSDQSEKLGFSASAGLWNIILVDDFNQDGLQDIFVGNAGKNQSITTDHLLYIHDFDHNGSVEQILCQLVSGKIYPSLDMDEMVSQMPILKKKYLYFKDYAQAEMKDLFDNTIIKSAKKFELNTLESALYYQSNTGFEKQPLPTEIQYSSIHAVRAVDINKDGLKDILAGGNHYLIKPQYGREDASRGWQLLSNRDSTTTQYSTISSLNIRGQIRSIETLSDDKLIIGLNNDACLLYSF